jgi:hypothetical protein
MAQEDLLMMVKNAFDISKVILDPRRHSEKLCLIAHENCDRFFQMPISTGISLASLHWHFFTFFWDAPDCSRLVVMRSERFFIVIAILIHYLHF